MSEWKLVEAVPESPKGKYNTSKREEYPKERTNRPYEGRFYRGGRGGSTGGRATNRQYRQPYPHMSKADRNYLSFMAVQQIKLIFQADSLCMDTFIRSYMDEAGYVPIYLVCNYQNVMYYGAPYQDIVRKLGEVFSNENEESRLEVDLENETIRLREGWEMWLMPNLYGGFGLPRYLKQVVPDNVNQMQQYYSYYPYGGEGNYYPNMETLQNVPDSDPITTNNLQSDGNASANSEETEGNGESCEEDSLQIKVGEIVFNPVATESRA